MIGSPSTPAQSSSFWRRTWHYLRAFDEALHTTEIDLLAARLDRVERQLRERNAENAYLPRQTETRHD
jgi:hypothetical protein